ncbi:Gti1/Pac2 family-domain-containing protein [Pholiota molesta]|nr:Gti1/Pac2 family-domain-containing protein [Pholiota molesta]
MQQPTCVGLRVRTTADAHVIFHAVHEGLLRMITRRLDTEERRAISSGSVYVWEERGANAEAAGMGIERWTDSIQWGPSRVRDEFLFYAEKRETQGEGDQTTSDSSETTTHRRRGYFRQRLTKQTYSVFVETPRGRRKWHMNTVPSNPSGSLTPSRPPPYGAATLAPLAYLSRLPPPPRHVLDEQALMSFSATITPTQIKHRSHM